MNECKVELRRERLVWWREWSRVLGKTVFAVEV